MINFLKDAVEIEGERLIFKRQGFRKKTISLYFILNSNMTTQVMWEKKNRAGAIVLESLSEMYKTWRIFFWDFLEMILTEFLIFIS